MFLARSSAGIGNNRSVSSQLGLLPLPKTSNPDHMKSNAEVDFVISEEDMEALNALKIKDYGEASKFPVFAG